MKQIIQDLKNGDTILEEVPAPMVGRGQVLIKTKRSLVSLGTERMLVEFGKAGWIEKARQQPEKVKQVLDKIKADGLKPTMETVFRKLGEPLPLGYCNAGEIIAVGEGVSGFQIGDRVASNGRHAEIVAISTNLVAKIPDNVSDEAASFTAIGAIGLQGIRLANPTFGETVVVTGLGLIGLITVQLLKANGCDVIGLDFDDKKVALARSFGVKAFNVANDTDPVKIVEQETGGVGADAVIITASTKSNDVIAQAAKMSRKRGRIVLIGVIGLDIQRSDFYEKELSFQVSCSYGPGRYDDQYEQKGHDYPIGFVRWTEQRNFKAVLQALSDGRLDVSPLITESVPLESFQTIYGNMRNPDSIASILEYSGQAMASERKIQISQASFQKGSGVLGIIGAGNFTAATVLPALKKVKASVKYISSASGLSGAMLAKKHGIPFTTTDYSEILSDPEVEAVLITTRHNAHASLVLEAMQAGKHVFVEKPLALTLTEIEAIEAVAKVSDKTLTVGFNRRFSPHLTALKGMIGANPGPMQIIATMNAGFIPENNWVHDMQVGGGRIIGEACHYFDLITYLTGSRITRVVSNPLGLQPNANSDNVSILLQYENGSSAVINYFSNGHRAYSKERIEVYVQGKTAIIDNFRRSNYFGFSKSGLKTMQDKGHAQQFGKMVNALKNGGSAIIPLQDILNTSRAAIAAVESIQTGNWVSI